MTSERLKALRRVLLTYQAGLAPELDLVVLCEEALDALEPLVALHEMIGGPVGDLTEALDEYERRRRT
jgi:hypothetical protein